MTPLETKLAEACYVARAMIGDHMQSLSLGGRGMAELYAREVDEKLRKALLSYKAAIASKPEPQPETGNGKGELDFREAVGAFASKCSGEPTYYISKQAEVFARECAARALEKLLVLARHAF